MQEILHEWVIVCNKEKYYLTENQYQVLLKGQNNRFVVFDNFTINPAYISSCYKQRVDGLKKIYKCKECLGNGIVFEGKKEISVEGIEFETGVEKRCCVCLGSGVDVKQKPKLLNDKYSIMPY